jgi:hypothetical protein
MWNKIFNIVICCLSPLYLATKAICPLCGRKHEVLSDPEKGLLEMSKTICNGRVGPSYG